MAAPNAALGVADVFVSAIVAVAMGGSKLSKPQENSRAAKRASGA
jgi:hypothetical protein